MLVKDLVIGEDFVLVGFKEKSGKTLLREEEMFLWTRGTQRIYRRLGVSDIGFSRVEGRVQRTGPTANAITIVIQLSQGHHHDIVDQPTQTYFAHYRSVNDHINPSDPKDHHRTSK